MIVLGVGQDKHIMMKVSVHLMMVAQMLRFIKREEVVQDLEHCRYPRSGGILNTMDGDHWAVLRPLVNDIQVPTEEHAEQPEVDAGQTGDSQVYEKAASSPSLPMSPVSPRVMPSKDPKQAEDVGALLMRSKTIVCEDSVSSHSLPMCPATPTTGKGQSLQGTPKRSSR